ncbi:hypothetical protein EVAR_67431_1 [Eumeta japonica]|uniref:Uncharacterized protein n=1 Tax=Eumeta variegata TaxID=151549 RepID=A0A4C1SCG4_EUMVA|nr:hypothetical protein EVAR_67431_1 [Eumeta japonica]
MNSGVTPEWVAPGAGRPHHPPLATPLFTWQLSAPSPNAPARPCVKKVVHCGAISGGDAPVQKSAAPLKNRECVNGHNLVEF